MKDYDGKYTTKELKGNHVQSIFFRVINNTENMISLRNCYKQGLLENCCLGKISLQSFEVAHSPPNSHVLLHYFPSVHYMRAVILAQRCAKLLELIKWLFIQD